jgi:chaperone modulatory protein CbpM
MFNHQEFMIRARLDAQLLQTWVEAGWLKPHQQATELWFSEIDLARAELIHDLGDDLGVNEHGVDVVLSLVDQVHGLRRTVRELLIALGRQPESLRREIVGQIQTMWAKELDAAEPPRSPV